MALRVSTSETVPVSDMESKSACSRLGGPRTCAVSQSLNCVGRHSSFSIMQHSQSIFWYDKVSVAARLPFKAVAVVSTVAMAARHVCGEIIRAVGFCDGELEAEQNLGSNLSVAGLGREGTSWKGQTGPRMDEGSRDMDPRDRYRCVGFFFHAITAVPELHALPLLAIRDLQPSRSFKVVTSVTRGPCPLPVSLRRSPAGHANCVKQPRHRAICPVHRDSFIGVSCTGPCSAFGRKHDGRSFNFHKTPMRTFQREAGQRSTRCGGWPPGASTRLAQEVTTSLCSRISKSVCEMVSHSQLWIQAARFDFLSVSSASL